MTIRTRLYLLFGFMLLITLSANFVSWNMVNTYGEFNNRARTLSRKALEAEKSLSAVYRHADFVRFSPPETDSEAAYEYEANVLRLLDALGRKAESTGEADKVRNLRNAYDDLADLLYEQDLNRTREDAADNRVPPIWTQESRETLARVEVAAGALVRFYEGALDLQIRNTVYTNLLAVLAIALGVLLAAAVLATLLIVIGKWLLGPLETLGTAAERIGSGDLEHRLTRLKNDEIGALGRSLNEMAAKLQQHQKKILEARELAIIGAMSSSVAHGLRNPLAGIRVTTQLLASEMPDHHDSRERIADIIEEVDRMNRRITALLEFGRPAELKLEIVSLRDLIAGSIREAQPVLEEHNIVVTVDNSTDDLWVHADRDQIVQTIAELLTNVALHAGDDTPTTISAQCEPPDSHGVHAVVLCVGDKGSGMDDAEREHAFDLFFSTRQDGSGLGLSCAKRVVELHGGRLELETAPGGGTWARIALPQAAQPSPSPGDVPSLLV